MVDRSAVGKRSRNKGRSFEQLVARELRKYFPEARRGYQARGGTKEAPDVDGTPWYIECKHGAPARDWAGALDQAASGSDGRRPMAVVRQDRGPIMVAMYAGAHDLVGMKGYGPYQLWAFKPEGPNLPTPFLIRWEDFLATIAAQ